MFLCTRIKKMFNVKNTCDLYFSCFDLLQTLKRAVQNCPRHKVVTAFLPPPFLRGCSQVSALSSDLWEEPACTGSGLMWRPAYGPQGVQSSGKWFAELPSDISCLALINSCCSVKLGIRLWHWLRPAPSRFCSACLAHSEERSGQRSTAKQWLFFFFHWSYLTDPETESVTPHYTMHLHAFFGSVQ